jgi:hypothetical protein
MSRVERSYKLKQTTPTKNGRARHYIRRVFKRILEKAGLRKTESTTRGILMLPCF